MKITLAKIIATVVLVAITFTSCSLLANSSIDKENKTAQICIEYGKNWILNAAGQYECKTNQ